MKRMIAITRRREQRMEGAKINEEVTMATHEGIDYYIKAKADWPQVTVLAIPPVLPSTKPQGPVRTTTDWHQVSTELEREHNELAGKSKSSQKRSWMAPGRHWALC